MNMTEKEANIWNDGFDNGYNKAMQEIAYSDCVKKEPFEILAYNKAIDDLLCKIKCDRTLLNDWEFNAIKRKADKLRK